jgi:integrase
VNRPRKTDRDLPPCVYRRHGALWYVKRGKWTRLGEDDGSAAAKASALTEYARLQGEPSSGMAQLIDDMLPLILVDDNGIPKAAATQKLYRLAAERLRHVFAEFAPEQIELRHVAAMRRDLRDEHGEPIPAFANRCVSVLRMLFDKAVEEGIAARNPCVGVKVNRSPKRTRRITLREFLAIRAEASPRLQVVMDLCALTGQRIGDVLSIRRDDCGDDGIAFTQQKTGARLIVGWNDELRAAVRAAQALHGRVASLYVVKGHGAAPLAYQPVWRDWQNACAAGGVEGATIHDLRAMAGSEAKLAGLDAQALLGHTSARMTAGYLRDREVPVVQGPSLKKRG